MNKKQIEKMKNGQGFVAALDQSGGSTPRALKGYGVTEDQYKNEDEMFDLVHDTRTRIIANPAFTSEKILGAILFEQTMDRKVEGKYTGDYLWEEKGIVPILKVDRGMEEEDQGVQLMKPMTDLDSLLDRALEKNVFGTKMRSVIKSANKDGIKKIVDQQFEIGHKIFAKGLVPILEPEVDINIPDKEEAEKLMKAEILNHLDKLPEEEMVMLKLSIPTKEGLFAELINHPNVLRVVALSGGYTREKSVNLLKRNPGLIASFSRALLEGLNTNQKDEEFKNMLENSVEDIYRASIV